jgi:hypothetical protein
MNKAFLSALIIATVFASCGRRVITGTGSMTSENRNVGNFSKIDISAPVTANIHVQPGARPSIKLEGYKNLVDEIDTEIEGNTLRITGEKFINFDTDKDIHAEITVASLSELGIHGSADARVDGLITGENFELKISGAGDVSIQSVQVSNFTATISGAGDVDIESGSAGSAHFKISGAGDITSFGMQAEDVVAKVSGAGDMKVTALKNLDAKVIGAGSIYYKGQPALTSETSGVGEIASAQ